MTSIAEHRVLRKSFSHWLSLFANRMLDLLVTDLWAKRRLRGSFKAWLDKTRDSVSVMGTGESRALRLRNRWLDKRGNCLIYLNSSFGLMRFIQAGRSFVRIITEMYPLQLLMYSFLLWRLSASYLRLLHHQRLRRRMFKRWMYNLRTNASLHRYSLIIRGKLSFSTLSGVLQLWHKQALINTFIKLKNRQRISVSIWTSFRSWRLSLKPSP